MRNETLDAVGNDGIGLRLDFLWLGDRYGHVISRLQRNSDPQKILESLEGEPTNEWPPSPPLQTLSIETLPDGRSVALLVGMAGRSHWSASIGPAANYRELIFDIACRHSIPAQLLGSEYRQVAPGPYSLSTEDKDVTIVDASGTTRIVPLVADNKTTRWRYTIAIQSTQY